ncbi:transcription termination factor, mitochondrial-like [Contarinia nasturtii]|uniref:transcription termination factor, mitochondrial-like n=1 Tax=Contarinia nasturtii TaxID=265458 RepID=UPI0012D4C15B|nr:transcription termination factor, mitochondrial-like [Contarinia nasturtii]
MLNITKSAFFRKFQVHMWHHSKSSWVDLITVQNVRAKKSFAFEPHMKYVLEALRTLLACTESKAVSIYDRFPSIRAIEKIDSVGCNITLLMKNGISSETLIENPFLLIMTEDVLQTRLDIIKTLDLTESMINDISPLLEMKEEQLKDVIDSMIKDELLVPGGNRIYYFSQKLKIEPNVVAKYCVKNRHSLVAPFDSIDRKIQILLDYNIKPLTILKSLYALDRSEEVYISRLERLMSLHIKDVKIWFFKCADDVFDMYLRKTQQKHWSKELAGERNENEDKIQSKCIRKIEIENKLNEFLECDSEEAAHIYYEQISSFDQIDRAKENIEYLRSHGVSLEILTGNSIILTMPLEQLQQKMHILNDMDPRHIDDFLPLICVDKTELEKFKKTLEGQELYEYSENPIYYFSERLKVQPSIISSNFAKNPIIFLRDPQMLQRKLDMLLAFNVEPNSILNSPLTFRMNLNKIENRLNELKTNSIESISSWMLTCTVSQLNTIIKRHAEQKDLLDDCSNAIEYLAKHLDWDRKTTQKALKSCPTLVKCNIIKIQKHLDFLLNETHFTKEDITSYPRVFNNSLETLRVRFNELAAIKCHPKRVYVICLEKKRYLEMIEKHCQSVDDKNVWEHFRKIEKRLKEK